MPLLEMEQWAGPGCLGQGEQSWIDTAVPVHDLAMPDGRGRWDDPGSHVWA